MQMGPGGTLAADASGHCLNLGPWGCRLSASAAWTSAADGTVLTDCQSAPAAARCCPALPEGSPGRPTGQGQASSRMRLARTPGDRSLPLSTSPEETNIGRALKVNSFPEKGSNQGNVRVCVHACTKEGSNYRMIS